MKLLLSFLPLLLLSCSCAAIQPSVATPEQNQPTLAVQMAAKSAHTLLPVVASKAPAADEEMWNSQDPLMIDITKIDDANVDNIIKRMDELKSKGFTKLWFRINSDGGSVFAGWKLIQAMESYGSPITCAVDVRAQSMGFYILQACDTRLMTKRAFLMAHEPRLQAAGNADELRDDATLLDAMNEGFIAQCLTRMKISKKEFLEKTRNRVWNMGYEEAKRVHAIDGDVSPKELPRLMKLPQPKSFLDLLLGN